MNLFSFMWSKNNNRRLVKLWHVINHFNDDLLLYVVSLLIVAWCSLIKSWVSFSQIFILKSPFFYLLFKNWLKLFVSNKFSEFIQIWKFCVSIVSDSKAFAPVYSILFSLVDLSACICCVVYVHDFLFSLDGMNEFVFGWNICCLHVEHSSIVRLFGLLLWNWIFPCNYPHFYATILIRHTYVTIFRLYLSHIPIIRDMNY